jgi:site-specific recombinase XerD
MILREAAQAWKQQMADQTEVDRSTADQYIGDVIRFCTWITIRGRSSQVEAIQPADARDYRDFLLSQGRAPDTVQRTLTGLRLFMEAQGRTGADNPFGRIAD